MRRAGHGRCARTSYGGNLATTRRGRARVRARTEARQQRRAAHRAAAAQRDARERAVAATGAPRGPQPIDVLREIDRSGLIAHLERVAPRILSKQQGSREACVRVLERLATCHDVSETSGWVRPIEAWRPRGRSVHRLLAQLIDHLLFLYPVPEFLHRAVMSGDRTWTPVAIGIGQGRSLTRDLREGRYPFLPPLTRRMVHEFLGAPADRSPWHAVRHAQVAAFGGRERIARVLIATGLGAGREPEDRWQRAIEWLVRNRSHMSVERESWVIAYIAHRFAADPRWELHGRSSLSVLRAMWRWRDGARIGDFPQALDRVFTPSGLPSWRTKEPDREGRPIAWGFREIRTVRELWWEGKGMHHCVYEYSAEVQGHRASIWSLTRDGKPAVTIEVNGLTIVQVRGRWNRMPDGDEREIIRRWAGESGLTIRNF